MNLQECKEQVAHEYCFQDWGQVQRIVCTDEMQDFLDAIATLYATEKVKEALKLAQQRLPSKDTGKSGCNYNDTDFDSESVVYGYNMAIDECGEKILSLETELIELITKEK